MKPLDTGALVKEYESHGKETEQAVQMVITSVASEDPRYVERASLSLSEEFPIGTKVFFLAEQAYGTCAQVSGATSMALSVILTVSGFMSHGLLTDCDVFDVSTSRKTMARTKGSRRSPGTKLERNITLPSKLPRLSDSRQK